MIDLSFSVRSPRKVSSLLFGIKCIQNLCRQFVFFWFQNLDKTIELFFHFTTSGVLGKGWQHVIGLWNDNILQSICCHLFKNLALPLPAMSAGRLDKWSKLHLGKSHVVFTVKSTFIIYPFPFCFSHFQIRNDFKCLCSKIFLQQFTGAPGFGKSIGSQEVLNIFEACRF